MPERTLLSRRLLCVGFGCAFVLHNLEEALGAPRLLAFLQSPPVPASFYQALTVSDFRSSLTVVTLIGLTVVAAAAFTPGSAAWSYAMLVLAAVLVVNAVGHVAWCLFFSAYVPGVFTAVVLNLPLALTILARGRRERWVGPRAYRTILPIALIVHGPLLVLLLRAMTRRALPLVLLLLTCVRDAAAQDPVPVEADFVVKDFQFTSGERLPELRLHYRTLGSPRRDPNGVVRNGVLVLHGTGGSGAQFLRPEFAGELFGAGQPLDASRYFIVLPDGIGHGKSSKPSDGLRARFPRYGYLDMVEAQHRLLTEGLGVNHLRLVMGTSMGGMHTWLWGQRFPAFMDALMPLASLPTQISGRNRTWRRIVIDAIRSDPEWRGGDYVSQPPSLRIAQQMLFLMSSNPVLRQAQMKTLAESDAVLDAGVSASMKTADANDVLYALEASRDYDPGPGLERIRAPLVAINSADDLINPPELGILEREITRVAKGRAIVLPLTPETRGHGSHTIAALWKRQLQDLLAATEP